MTPSDLPRRAASARISPCLPPCGELRVPGDKSVSHRLAMLCAIADGHSVIRGYLRSEDCLHTLCALSALGAVCRFRDSGELEIHGTGGRLLEPAGRLDLGNSGTGLRLLTGLLAGYPLRAELGGDDSLQSRPMHRIAEPLRRMGAQVDLSGERGTAPLRVRGGALRGIECAPPVASAQVKSAVLLAALHAKGETTLTEPLPTRDHTERLFRKLGLPIRTDGPLVVLRGLGARGPRIAAGEWDVPGDFSSAAFWIVSAAVRPGAEVLLRGVGLNPRRTALLDALRRMGAHIEVFPDAGTDGWEPTGDIRVRGGILTGTEIGGADIPNLIDELPVLAAAAALARGETLIRDAAELRVKESDRIAATVENLVRMGVEAEARPDGMRIDGPARLTGGGVLDSHGDHRIAMAMTVLAGCAEAPSILRHTDCVSTSYPGFWNDLASLGGLSDPA